MPGPCGIIIQFFKQRIENNLKSCWNEGIIYHIKGLSWDKPGAVIEQCMPPNGNVSGLAWNGSAEILWEATNSETDTIYQLDPATCTVLSTLAPQPVLQRCRTRDGRGWQPVDDRPVP